MKTFLFSSASIAQLYHSHFKQMFEGLETDLSKNISRKVSIDFYFDATNEEYEYSELVSNKGLFRPETYKIHGISKTIPWRRSNKLTVHKSFQLELIPKIEKAPGNEQGTLTWYVQTTLLVTFSDPKEERFFRHNLVTIPLILLPSVIDILTKWFSHKPLPCELISSIEEDAGTKEDIDYYDNARKDQEFFIYPKNAQGN